MEQAKERLEAHLKILEKANASLGDALAQRLTDIVRDAVIQRFEFVFELAWKTMQIAARHMGTVCNSPREAVKTAFKIGWIKDVDAWLASMEARNQTSHTYNEQIAEQVYEVAAQFPELVTDLLAALRKVV